MSISDNHSCINRTDLYMFIQSVGTESEFTLGTLQNKSVSTRWDFTGAFSFVVTVATTIGKSKLYSLLIVKLDICAFVFITRCEYSVSISTLHRH